MNRRGLLRAVFGAFAAGGVSHGAAAAAGAAVSPDVAELQKNWRMFLAQGINPPSPAQKVTLSKDEWRKRLTKEQFYVLREEGTERAGTSPLNAEKREGIYACAGCELPLFTSQMKYESGTGWPSFYAALPGATGTKADRKLGFVRTEVHCGRCGGHLGHIFDDGPAPRENDTA